MTRPSFREGEDEERTTGVDTSLVQNGAELAHWRGALQIHFWFERLLPACDHEQVVLVEQYQLKALLRTLRRVEKRHILARFLLPDPRPLTPGFSPYNGWYFHEITRSIAQLEHVLSVRPLGRIYYRTSW